ncbi:hypothetical protein DEU56DRAFT_757312 [Suillus clintonianus]|uniref:uncharacterized protein n=1 Tax=Suillus clintonianus TaxID=1904413 RepID=UPI001B882F55|nr:uncharacterized protein DEU56DRAFT_757312 [Suillus clintonianus]KAG2132821.1 hypothetical protein DEU56DRAFT_757312 [Suillus clintonianus]
MHACLTYLPTGSPISGHNPDHPSRQGRATGRIQMKCEEGSNNIPILSRTPSRHPSLGKNHKHPPSSNIPSDSSDIPSDSSDDEIIGPITPPPILRDLARYVKSVKARPEPYKRTNPNVIERLCGEECLGCNGSTNVLDNSSSFQGKTRLARRMKSLSPEARAQATIAIGANVEWRRARAVAAALKIDAIVQHKKFMCLTLESEAKTYVNAASEPLDTSMEALVNCTASELDDRESCSVATYKLELESFTAADKELDHVEHLTLQLLDSDASATSSDEDNFGGSFGSMRGTSTNSAESDD